MTNRWFH